MIPIIREFFAGLRERDELDRILPDLLLGMGFEVFSRPMTGVRQFGVDVAAVGTDRNDGRRKVHLFTVKQGDLTRQSWNGSAQAVRQSLDEIRDAYLPTGISPSLRSLPVVIVVSLGGNVLQNVQPMLNGYFAQNSAPGVREYACWTGDTLATAVMDGLFREEALTGKLRSDLRRAAAMVEEPETAIGYFVALMTELLEREPNVSPITKTRILHMCLWILFVWGRETGNLEAAYQCCELALLQCWGQLWPLIEKDRGTKCDASHAFHAIAELYLRVSDTFLAKVLPYTEIPHGVSEAIPSRLAVDINLALFKILGRLSLRGLWAAWLATIIEPPPVTFLPTPEVENLITGLVALVDNNPGLSTPFLDNHAIEISLALTILGMSRLKTAGCGSGRERSPIQPCSVCGMGIATLRSIPRTTPSLQIRSPIRTIFAKRRQLICCSPQSACGRLRRETDNSLRACRRSSATPFPIAITNCGYRMTEPKTVCGRAIAITARPWEISR